MNWRPPFSDLRLVVPCVALALFACRSRDDLHGKRGVGSTAVSPPSAVPASENASTSATRTVAFDFVANRASASVFQDGALTIDCGSPDFAKYVEGGFRTSWLLHGSDSDDGVARVDGHGANLYFPLDGDVGGVERNRDGSLSFRVRVRAAVKNQLASIFVNEHRLGDISLPDDTWAEYEFRAVGDVLKAGENRLRFYFRHAPDNDGIVSAAAFSDVAIGGAKTASSLFMTANRVEVGGVAVASLTTSGTGRLSYYIDLPPSERNPSLVVDVQSAAKTAIRIAASTGSASDVWSASSSKDWQPARIDLSEFAGQVVRIDFVGNGPVSWGAPRVEIDNPSPPPPAEDTSAISHVVVWVVSSLRADHITKETGNFMRFANRGVHFETWAAAPSAASAHVGLMTGNRPGSHSSRDTPTLASIFSAAGFTTALISGNGFINDEAGFARGFDVYDNPMRRRHPHSARVLWQRARRFLGKHKNGRTLLYLATSEPHLPYTPSAESIAATWSDRIRPLDPARTTQLAEAIASGRMHMTGEQKSFIRALYAAEVRDADLAFGRMLSDLDELGIADRTVVVLVGDHGEELWERGNYGHGRNLYEETLAVPMVISAPMLTREHSQTAASTIDLLPTLMDLASIEDLIDVHGASLLRLPAWPSRPLFAYGPLGRAMRIGRYKLVVPSTARPALYDLVADPGESSDSLSERPLVARYLRNAFGLAVAYQSVWTRKRWGEPNNTTEAFAADHGL